MNPTQEIQIQRERAARYFSNSDTLMLVIVGVPTLGLGFLAAFIYRKWIAPQFTARQAEALRYWIEGNTLRIDEGVYFKRQAAIPLDRVTDVVLYQGPLLRHMEMWSIRIQTAGMGHAAAEGVLHAVAHPEEVRDELIAARDRAVGRPVPSHR